jgi:hypothetical protein
MKRLPKGESPLKPGLKIIFINEIGIIIGHKFESIIIPQSGVQNI